MIGFSIEFKRWYVIVRGPKGRTYLAICFAKQIPPVTSPLNDLTYDDEIKYGTYRCDLDNSLSSIFADAWIDDVEEEQDEKVMLTDEQLARTLKLYGVK